MKFILPINAERYCKGLEDDFIYHIGMFGLFNKQECLDAGFTPDFEEDKIPFLLIDDKRIPIKEGDFIITFLNGKKQVWSSNDYFENISVV